MRHVLGSLARRWLTLHDEVKLPTTHLKTQTKTAAPRLVEAVGIGFDIAAEMLTTAGDNRTRIKSEAAFAKMCGACPHPGRLRQDERPAPPQPRRQPPSERRPPPHHHRRMRWHQPTIDYVARRTKEGLSKREIIRCLKRFLAREIYHCYRR